MSFSDAKRDLRRLADRRQAANLQRFFKTGPGEYGEGDRFLGLRVPQVRAIAKQYKELQLSDIHSLLRSPIHEERHLALFILLTRFAKASEPQQNVIYSLYLGNTTYINNWDLVDCSAPRIVGGFLMTKSKKPLLSLAKSDSLWERRIAIMATLFFINNDAFSETLKLSKLLLHDEHDLIHKAVGWMLREVGNRDRDTEEEFLKPHYRCMPRTMLRYAIEKFPEKRRQQYLKGKV